MAVRPLRPVKWLLAVLATASWGCCDLAGAVPPPPEQSAANCSAPTYASDQLVCADPELLALDRRMVELLAAAIPVVPAAGSHWFEPQQEWFRRRSLCAFSERHAACLRAAYGERIDLLSALARQDFAKGPPALPAICIDAPWGNAPVRLHLDVQAPLTIEDGRGRVLVVASALPPRDDWSPFVRFVIEDAVIRLKTPGGAVVRCRIVEDRRPPEAAPHGNRPQ